jgi:hypothetical protein
MDFEMKFGWDGVKIHTANNGGHSLDAIADMCVDKLMSVSENAPDVIRAQAEAFKQKSCIPCDNILRWRLRKIVQLCALKSKRLGFLTSQNN